MRLLYTVPLLRGVVLRLQNLAFRLRHRRFIEGRVVVYGWPLVSRMSGSTISIGAGTTLISDTYFSEPGVSGPCILRTLDSAAQIVVGAGTGMSGVSVCAAESVVIGEQCLIGSDVLITDTDFHAIAAEGRRHSRIGVSVAPVSIGRNVFVGARAVILKGVTVGDDSVIGAGAVVTHDVAPGVIAAGVPARQIGRVERGVADV